MVESGTIVLHIAAKSAALAPTDASGLVGVTSWAVAALNSVEPCVRNLIHLDVFHAGGTWTKERRPQAEAALDEGLAALSAWPDGKEYLEDRFTGELMMTTGPACAQRFRRAGAIPGLRRLPPPLRGASGVWPGAGGAAAAVPRKCAGLAGRGRVRF